MDLSLYHTQSLALSSSTWKFHSLTVEPNWAKEIKKKKYGRGWIKQRCPPTHVDLSLVSNVSDSKTNEEGRENSSPNKPFFMAFPQQSHRINTLFASGTSSCRAFILSAILSLRNCHERNTNTQKSKLKTPPKHNTTQHEYLFHLLMPRWDANPIPIYKPIYKTGKQCKYRSRFQLWNETDLDDIQTVTFNQILIYLTLSAILCGSVACPLLARTLCLAGAGGWFIPAAGAPKFCDGIDPVW